MKKKRKISIYNPQILKIRNNLRKLLLEWAKDQYLYSHESYDPVKVLKDSYGKPYSRLSKEQRKKILRMRREVKRNNEIIYSSICICPSCSSIDRNMIYYPEKKGWYCHLCYRRNVKKKERLSLKILDYRK